jgi:hypothetical protein
MIHDSFKNRAKGESIMPAEGCRKSKNWNSILRGPNMGIVLWAPNFRMKEGQDAAVSKAMEVDLSPAQRQKYPDVRWSGSVMGLVDYNSLQTLWRKFEQAPWLQQGLIRCDGPFWALNGRIARGGLANSQISIARCPMLATLLYFYCPVWPQVLCLRCSLLRQFYAVHDN